MQNTWQLQEAKNRLSELVDRSLKEGPQVITRRGEETVVVLSAKEYRKLKEKKEGLVDFFLKSPLKKVELEIERDKGFPREVKL